MISKAERLAIHLTKAILDAPCPWSACCLHYNHPDRWGETNPRLCWKAKALAKARASKEKPG